MFIHSFVERFEVSLPVSQFVSQCLCMCFLIPLKSQRIQTILLAAAVCSAGSVYDVNCFATNCCKLTQKKKNKIEKSCFALYFIIRDLWMICVNWQLSCVHVYSVNVFNVLNDYIWLTEIRSSFFVVFYFRVATHLQRWNMLYLKFETKITIFFMWNKYVKYELEKIPNWI